MAHPTDLRGLPSGTASTAARDAVETALWRMMSGSGSPEDDLQAAAAADPAWGLPHVIRAGHLLEQGDPALVPRAAGALLEADRRRHGAAPRERAHAEAVTAALEGRWQEACETWDALLLEAPCDALALHWAHAWDLLRGQTRALRGRVAGALPEWSPDDPLYPHLLGLYAFALAEHNLHAAAEDAARQALQRHACVPWALLAVAQAWQAQGRHDEGSAWLRQHQDSWGEGNALAPRLWWQMALFRLEAMDLPGTQRLVDGHFSGAQLDPWRTRLDATALLWRLHLLGVDMTARFDELLRRRQLNTHQAGRHALADVHAMLALVGAGDLGCAERWIAACARVALAAEDARRANHRLARELGLPMMRGLLALARGDGAGAAAQLYPLRGHWHRLGGTQVQCELFDQCLLAAVAAGGPAAVGRQLINERLMARPATPLTRHWAERLRAQLEVRA